MELPLKHLPPEVAAPLRAFHRRKLVFRLLRAAFAALSVYLVLGLVAMHLDRFLFLDAGLRAALSYGAHGLAAAVLAGGVLASLLRRATVQRLAYELESRLPPDAQERFVTLDDVLRRGGLEGNPVALELLGQLRDSAVEYGRSVRAGALVRDRRLRGWLAVACGLLAVCGLLALPEGYEFPLMAERFWRPTANLPKPSFVRLDVSPAELRVGLGGEAILQAQITDRTPEWLRGLMQRLGLGAQRCRIALAEGRDGELRFEEAEVQDLSRIQRDLFLYTRGDLRQDFRYRMRCGDAETELRRVEVVAQPRIVALRLDVTPPTYAGLPSSRLESVRGALSFLPGSEIRVTFETDQDVPERRILVAGAAEPVAPEWDAGRRAGSAAFTLQDKLELEIRVANAQGFENVDRARVVIGLRKDQEPMVQLERPAGDVEAVPGALIPLRGTAGDDLGLTEVGLRFVVNPDPEREPAPQALSWPPEPEKAKEVALPDAFDLDRTGAVPGDRVQFHVFARDAAGNEGRSREILIQVNAFTRGENERRRLAALRGLREALEALGAQPFDADGNITAEAYEKALKAARARGLALPEAPAWASVLEALEREQIVTDAPRHQEDLRMLRGALARASAEEAAAFAGTTLPELTAFRTGTNLLWRQCGMRHELARLRELLEAAATQEEWAADKKAAFARRAKLYLEALQDGNAELLELARAMPALDEARVSKAIGRATMARLYLGRAAPKKQLEEAEKLDAGLREAIELLRDALGPLWQSESVARAKLNGLYERGLKSLASPEAGSNAAAARRWIEADARMLGREPYAPFWPRFVRHALAAAFADFEEGGEAARAKLAECAAALERLDEPVRQAVEDARAGAEHLAFEWEAGRVRELERIPAAERNLELGLLNLQWRARVDPPDPARDAEAFAALRGLPIEGGGALAELAEPGRGARMEPAARLEALRAAVQRIEALDFDPARLASAAARAARTAAELQKLGSDSAEAAGPFTARMREWAEASERDLTLLARARGALALRLGDLHAGAPQAELEELAYVRLSQTLSRHEARSWEARAGLSKELASPEPDSRAVASARGLALALASQHAALAAQVEKLAQACADGSLLKEREKYPVLQTWASLRRMLDVAAALAKPEAAAVARTFLGETPEAAQALLAQHAQDVGGAREALDAAARALDAEAPARAAYEEALASARGRLGRFQDGLKLLEGQDDAARLLADAQGLAAELERLALAERPDAETLNRKRYALGEARKRAERLVQALATLQAGAEDPFEAYLEAPAALEGVAELAKAAEASRRRVAEQARAARSRFMLGVFGALAPGAQGGDEEAPAAFLRRLAFSDWFGVGGVRLARSGRDAGAGDPLRKFFDAELEKARQRGKELMHYRALTREYLETLKDWVRY
ncbi:MAG: DUF4175 domain-containing protein [Planctomycetota bacterium]|nr:DUF4175 domain-containing protein [Planctomycetota bacterium]